RLERAVEGVGVGSDQVTAAAFRTLATTLHHATQHLHVRPAALDDVDDVLDLLAEAAAWTAARGFRNWQARFPRRPIEASARNGELHVAELDGATVATVTLQWSDPRFWGGADLDAGYVHRLVVRRAHAGEGLG